MNNLGDYLKKRADELGMDRADQLADIQAYLDSIYPGQCRVVSLNKGVLKITTPNSSVASELRFSQVKLRSKFGVSRIMVVSG